MRTLVLLAVGLFALSAQAGGIGFNERYVGTHPTNGNEVTLTQRDEKFTLNVANTLGRAEDLVLVFVSRNAFEAIFELRRRGETPEKHGEHIANVVTTGDCQIVRDFALVFPSGVQLRMSEPKKADAAARRDAPRAK